MGILEQAFNTQYKISLNHSRDYFLQEGIRKMAQTDVGAPASANGESQVEAQVRRRWLRWSSVITQEE